MYKVTIINGGKETVIHHPSFNDLKVQEGQINKGINVSDSFSFTIMPNNPGYNIIRPLKTLINVFNMKTGAYEFEGRILMPTESMSDSGVFAKAYVCESELGYLNDSAQRHGEYHDITVRRFFEIMIANHNADIANDDIDKTFRVGEVTVTNTTDNIYRYLGYESTFDTIDDKLISRLGGELRVRKENGVRYIDYLDSIGATKQTEIRLAKNLKSITKEADPDEVITRLVPLGERIESDYEDATDASEARLTIESVNNGKEYIEDTEAKSVFGVITKSQAWDDITIPSNLLRTGQQFLKENNRVKVKYSITALDLSLIGLDTDSFEVGNYYPVINPVMGINEHLRVIAKTIDIIEPDNNDLTIGDRFPTASQYQYEANKAQKEVVGLKSTVSRQNTKIGTLSINLSTTKDELEATKQQLQNFEQVTDQDIESITNSITTMLDTIQQLEQIVTDLVSVVSPEEIQQMKDDIQNNSTNIKTNTDAIFDINNQISSINIEIENIKQRLDNGGL
ncbi:lysin [Siminovitchia terrae]|uniref:Lysin n=1 Tax=Siminovitchia terrae TaxID=1914933 RepID=A0A429X2T8_SIMTE|nr:phage tail spike protein [Siminovitchia terrae]RST57685.1 lysin [Siminovitchia terrae]